MLETGRLLFAARSTKPLSGREWARVIKRGVYLPTGAVKVIIKNLPRLWFKQDDPFLGRNAHQYSPLYNIIAQFWVIKASENTD